MSSAAVPVPPPVREQIDRWADAWVTSKFTRPLQLRAQNPGPWNYPVAVCSEWRGRQFYLNVRYRVGGRPRSDVEEFVVRHTRMTLTGFGRFDLAYFRHTDRWCTTHRGLTAQQCFKEIEGNETFWPIA
jgi:hypothetical protein